MYKKTLKVIILIPNLGMGGTERMVSRLANDLSNLGLEVVILLMVKKKKFYSVDRRVRIVEPSYQLQSGFFSLLKIVRFLRRQIIREKPHTILNMGYILLGIISSLSIDVRLLISWRRSPYRKRFPGNKVLELIYDIAHKLLSFRVNGVIAQTQAAKKFYEQRYSCEIKVIPNYVSLNMPSEDAARKKLVINVGRFISTKNQLELVKIFKKLQTSERWSLYFLGDGEMRRKVQAEAGKCTKQMNIEFLGNVTNVSYWYFRSSIFAFTSSSEGFPNALAEAMSAGCACIAYDCVAGPSELIDDGVNGFLIPIGEKDQYKEKLQLLMEDADLRRRFGEAARKKMEEFDSEKIVQKFYDFITAPLI